MTVVRTSRTGRGRPPCGLAGTVRAGGAALAVVLAAGCPSPAPEAPPAVPRAVAVAFDDGVRRAQACEGEIDADLQPYAACVDDAVRAVEPDAARRAGVHFQAWLMADLALQHSAHGAPQARARWWRALQADLVAARLTLDELGARRGLDPADLRRRAARQVAG